MSEYNGHPSWEHWNVSLWLLNDEWTYKAMCSIANRHPSLGVAAEQFKATLENDETPDGAPYSLELIEYAMEEIHAEAWDDV